jgi:hypothetical protein
MKLLKTEPRNTQIEMLWRAAKMLKMSKRRDRVSLLAAEADGKTAKAAA